MILKLTEMRNQPLCCHCQIATLKAESQQLGLDDGVCFWDVKMCNCSKIASARVELLLYISCLSLSTCKKTFFAIS